MNFNCKATIGNLKLQLYKFNEVIDDNQTHKIISIDIPQTYLNSTNYDIKELFNEVIDKSNLELNIYMGDAVRPIATFKNLKFSQMFREINNDKVIVRINFKKKL